MFDVKTMKTDAIVNLIIMREKYPQLNSPQDREELLQAKSELSRRGLSQPAKQDATDFAYRLQRYGY